MKISILLILWLGAVPVLAAGTSVADSFVGRYKLEKATKGECSTKIEVMFVKNNSTSQGRTLGFLSTGQPGIRTIALLSAIDQGWTQVRQQNSSTGQLKTYWQEVSSRSYPSRVEIRQLLDKSGSLQSPLDRGEYFQALLYPSFLEVNQGYFSSRGDSLLELSPRRICRYSRY